jgi:hypothetical protein
MAIKAIGITTEQAYFSSGIDTFATIKAVQDRMPKADSRAQ